MQHGLTPCAESRPLRGMRTLFFACVFGGIFLVACAESISDVEGTTTGDDAMDAGVDDDAEGDSASSDGSRTNAAAADAGVDATARDASSVNDAGHLDTGTDAPDGGSLADASDAGTRDAAKTPDAGCVPPLGNFAICGTASATSTYSGSYRASSLNDDALDTSWYATRTACPAGTCAGESIHVDIVLDRPRTVGRVKLFGNRDLYSSGYDVMTARIELLDGAGSVVHMANVTTSKGFEPNGDVDHAVTPAVALAKTVRVIVLTAESNGPGLGEVQVFAN